MADKGNIGACYCMLAAGKPFPGRSIMPIWEGYREAGTFVGDPMMAGKMPQDGSLSGTVKKNNVALADAWVHLFHRPTCYLIASTRSAADGTFTFNRCLNKAVSNYFVLAIDPVDEYNIMVFDTLTPV